MKTKKVCFASVDVERNIENLNKILATFEKYKIPVTLFVTGKILKQQPELFKKLERDYEIACHGFSHRFWDNLNFEERKKELENFVNFYQKIFSKKPKGFRAPSHIIDYDGMKLLEDWGFLYDSSVVPHYPPFKKYRGYKGRRPLFPYYPQGKKILEIPVSGQLLGIPLAGAWISRLPFWFYNFLFKIYTPPFLTLNMHSWDALGRTTFQFLKKLEKLLKLLKNKGYLFLTGEQIYDLLSKNR
ncbi:MAG: polysaccharide deacetylase family protein [Patescibacteria group bacterium]|nr:polysaccharide deacetylase family protein [Patescibacteria group bacterium]